MYDNSIFIYMYIYTTRSNYSVCPQPLPIKPNKTNPLARSPKVVPRSLGKKWPSCPGSALGVADVEAWNRGGKTEIPKNTTSF